MLDRFRRSPAPIIETPRETSEGGDKLLTLEGVNTTDLYEAIKKSPGELIFSTVPYSDLMVGILGQAQGLKEIPSDRPNTGWKNAEVPISSGLDYHFLVVDNGRYAERGDGTELSKTMQVHIPEGSSAARYTGGRDVQIVLDTDLRRIRWQVEKGDFVLAVGNSAVVNTALALAEAELDARADYIGLQESHGLLLLSAIKRLGIDWRQQVGRNRQLDRLVERLEHDMIDLGVLPIVLHHLGWDNDKDDRYDYWQLDEERVARRLRAFDLLLDPAKATVLTALSKIAFGEQAPAGRKQQGYIVALAGGDYNRFVNAEVENLLINYLGISKV